MIQSGKQLFVKKRKEKTQMTPTLARFILQEEIEEYEAQLAKNERDLAKNERDLAKNKRDLAKKDKEIARLRAKLAEKSQKKRK